MSFVLVAISPAHAYSKYTQNKALKEQTNAINAAREADARKAAEAETMAQVAANTKTAEAKRRRRSSALSLGGDLEALGGTPAATALGGVPARTTAPAGSFSAMASTALGSASRAGGGASNMAYRGTLGKVAMQ